MSLKSDKEKSQYLQDLIKKTYLTDVIERNHIQKDISILDDLLKIVASSIGSLTNPKKLENTFASVKQTKIDDATISIYLSYFAEAYLLRKVEQYDIKGKKYINTPQKYLLHIPHQTHREAIATMAGGPKVNIVGAEQQLERVFAPDTRRLASA